MVNISYQIFDGEAITDAARYLYDQKSGVVVASSGNTGHYEYYFYNPYVISIGATDVDDNLASFSSKGPYVDFTAPGTNIRTTSDGGTYATPSGTSFSAPIASGVIALLYSYDPTLSSPQVYEILKNSSVDLGDPGHDFKYGWGKIDAFAALSEIGAINVDDIPPEVQILNIQEGQTLTDVESIQIAANDNVGIKKVNLYIDGKLIDTVTDDNLIFSLDTKKYLDGQHVIKVEAFDTSLNQSETSLLVAVKNSHQTLPTIKIENISENEVIQGSKKVQINVENYNGDSKVSILIDNALRKILPSSPYQFNLNSNKIATGNHVITAQIVYEGIVFEDSVSFIVEKSKQGQK